MLHCWTKELHFTLDTFIAVSWTQIVPFLQEGKRAHSNWWGPMMSFQLCEPVAKKNGRFSQKPVTYVASITWNLLQMPSEEEKQDQKNKT